MTTADKLITVAENVPKVYHAGQLNVIENTSTLKKSASGSAILIDDVSPVTHNMGVKVRGKNLIPYPYVNTTRTVNGIIFTDNGDGSVTINGTATADVYYDLTRLKLYPKGYYFMSGCPAGGSTSRYFLNCVNASGMAYTLYINDIGKGTIINLSSDDTLVFSIRIKKGTTVENLTFKPQLELGTTATAYTPYVPDLTAVKVIKSNASGEAVVEYTPTADGSVENVSSLYPNTTLTTDTEGVLIDCEYYKDIDANDVIERTVTTYTNPKVKIIGSYAFYDCSSLTTADFPVATSVGNYAFHSCSKLTTVDLPNATSVGNSAFYGCKSLITADLPNATSVGSSAFQSCSSLTTVDLPNATSVRNTAFYGCSSLTTVDLPNVTSVESNVFQNCSSLTTVDLPNATSVDYYAFQNCSSLTIVDFPNVTSVGNSAFYGCKSLITADFPIATSISSYAFEGCSKLTELILRNSTICSLSNKNAFTGCTLINGTGGYIYVPSSLVDAYKTATNWVTYASKFRALEDYTVDGTTTGALDESKVKA